MSANEWKLIEEASAQALKAFHNLSREVRLQRMIDAGLFDKNGRLSSNYGGPGEATPQPAWGETAEAPHPA